MIFKRIALTILLMCICAGACEAQLIVTPVAGIATIDVATCGQGAAGPNPSCSFKLTLTANATIAFNNVFSGASVNLFINPATFTVTWPASVPTPPTLTASQNNSVSLRFDGTTATWLVTSGGGGIGAVDPAFVGTALTAVGGAPQIFQSISNINAGSTSTPNITFSNSTTQSHTYLVGVEFANSVTISSVTTTQGDTCSQLGTNQTVSSKLAAIYTCSNVIGGASTVITANLSGAATFTTMLATELGPSSVDVSAVATGNSTAPASGNITTTNVNDLLLGICLEFTSSGGAFNTPGPGYLITWGINGANGGSNSVLEENQTVYATGTYSASATLALSTNWAMWAIAMKGTAATPVLSNASGTGPFNLGTITTPLTPVQFKISGGQITAGQGQLNINVTSGAITNGAFALEATVDNGASWVSVPCVPRTLANIVGGDPVPLYSAQCSLVGLMGETGTTFRFGPYQGYGISNLVVWGSI